jgi:hypothetical protein
MEERKERVRAERSDKKIRVNSSYTKPLHDKLEKLAIACGVTKTELQAYMVELCLDREAIINEIQDRHKSRSHFRIIPSRVNGELKFIFAEKLQKAK